MSNQQIQSLGTRPKLITKQFRTVDVLTNYKTVDIKYSMIYLYSIKFDEQTVGPTNRLMYNKMLMNSRRQLEQVLGANYCFNGRTFYAFQKCNFKEKQLFLEFEGNQILAYLNFIKQISLVNINDNSKNKQNIMFLNSSLKNVLRKIGYNQIGKSRKYFDMKKNQDLGDLLLYRGYETSFSVKLNGLLLKIEPANRIVRKQTVLSFITNLYDTHRALSKQDKRNVVKQSLINHSVMANYGTSVTWKIEDVVFDMQMADLKLDDSNQSFNLLEYYKCKHNIIIENTKQPLLKSTDRLNKVAFLIPELCLMTGIPENCDERKRMQISKSTIKDASYKLNKIMELNNLLSQSKQTESGWKTLRNIGINVHQDFLKITAEEIDCTELMLGQNPPGSNRFDSIDRGRQACFQLFDRAIFKNKVELNMFIIHYGFDTREIKKVFTSTSEKLYLPIKIAQKDLGRFDNNWFEALESCVEHKKQTANLLFFIIPAKAKAKYPDIKKLCYSDQDNYILSQVALETKLANQKSMRSVATKILLQMAVKVGNILWVPQPPKSTSKIMIIGMAIVKIPGAKSSVVAYNSTKDKLYSRFFSSYRYQNAEGSSSIIEKAGQIILQCIKSYVDYNNNEYPEVIIVLRQGSTDAQTTIIQQNQVKDALSSINNSNKAIKLVYISLDKKPTTKFFKKIDGRGVNPNAGTLVRDDVVSKQGDFYLISNQNKMSAVVPVYFKVLFNNTSDKDFIDTGFLAKLFYGQCFNYMNWTGSVRVPAQLQYACKLAKFKSQFFKGQQIHQKLQNLIYYI